MMPERAVRVVFGVQELQQILLEVRHGDIAGAVNAGGFLAVQQYTSHMSGILSSMADYLALGAIAVFLQGLAALLFFVLGAATSAVLVNFGRRSHLASEFALPLLLEAGLLLCFGLLGGNLEQFRWLAVPATVMLLCYIMGLQNAIITKMSRAEIRTTHVTGMVTDIGIELGKLFYWNVSADAGRDHFVRADRSKLAILGTMVGLFFVGGLAGALSFSYFGFVSTVPLAILLATLAALPVIDDIQGYWRHH